MLVTAVAIGREAWLGWQHPHAPNTPLLGIALNGAGGAINLVWALVLIRSGRRWKSPALVAGGKHIITDVWTTGGVLVGFALVPLHRLAASRLPRSSSGCTQHPVDRLRDAARVGWRPYGRGC